MEQKVMCPNCGGENRANQQFCGVCGAKLVAVTQQQGVRCSNCGSQNVAGQQFCGTCGARLTAPAPQVTAASSQEAAIKSVTPTLLSQQVEVKPTWGLAWGLWWRMAVLGILIGGTIYLIIALVLVLAFSYQLPLVNEVIEAWCQMQQVAICPNCGAEGIGQRFCTSCGTRLQIVGPQEQVWGAQPVIGAPVVTRETVPAHKYTALRAIATIYKIIGWVIMVGGSLFSIALAVVAAQGAKGLGEFMPWASEVGMMGFAIIGVVGSVLYGLFLLAFADLCYLLMDIERNTRLKE